MYMCSPEGVRRAWTSTWGARVSRVSRIYFRFEGHASKRLSRGRGCAHECTVKPSILDIRLHFEKLCMVIHAFATRINLCYNCKIQPLIS